MHSIWISSDILYPPQIFARESVPDFVRRSSLFYSLHSFFRFGHWTFSIFIKIDLWADLVILLNLPQHHHFLPKMAGPETTEVKAKTLYYIFKFLN